MAYIDYEVVPVSGGNSFYSSNLKEVIEYLNENLYENFYISVDTDYDYDKVIEKVQNEIWNVFNIKNVDDIS